MTYPAHVRAAADTYVGRHVNPDNETNKVLLMQWEAFADGHTHATGHPGENT